MKAAPNTVAILGGDVYQLRWDKGAMFRADELGLFAKRKPSLGFASAAKYVWAMGPASLRERCAGPEQVAELIDVEKLGELWDTINNAVAASRETTAKNASGSTNGPLPASS